MKKLLLLCGFVSFSTFAAEINIPSKDLLDAARTLVAQDGPSYIAQGKIVCTSVKSGGGSPTADCTINIKGSKAVVENANKIISVVAKEQGLKGTKISFAGEFEVSTVYQATTHKTVPVGKIILK